MKGARPWNYARIRLACQICGKTYEAPPSQANKNSKFCSMRCSGKAKADGHLAKYKFAKGRLPWNKRQIRIACKVCGTERWISPCRRKTAKYCSPTCQAAGRRQIPDDHRKCYGCQRVMPITSFYGSPRRNGKGWVYCKPCHKSRNREYALKNKEAIRRRSRNYMRRRYVRSTNRKYRVTGKRPYPQDASCELCACGSRKLSYHHWDDALPALGMWICNPCHRTAHWLEHHDPSIYWTLRHRLSAEFGHDGSLARVDSLHTIPASSFPSPDVTTHPR